MGAGFAVDPVLLARVRARLAGWPALRFVTGGAGSGKSTVCAALSARLGTAVLDVDARLYGSWHGRLDPRTHPANHAWSTAGDALAWQLALDPAAFLAFHDAATVEALDLLADDLAADGLDRALPLLVDGGFGSVGALASAVPSGAVACLSLAPSLRDGVWTLDADRRGFLDVVAGVATVDDPVGRFLALDAALAERMEADARAAGVPVVVRGPGISVDDAAAAIATHLRL